MKQLVGPRVGEHRNLEAFGARGCWQVDAFMSVYGSISASANGGLSEAEFLLGQATAHMWPAPPLSTGASDMSEVGASEVEFVTGPTLHSFWPASYEETYRSPYLICGHVDSGKDIAAGRFIFVVWSSPAEAAAGRFLDGMGLWAEAVEGRCTRVDLSLSVDSASRLTEPGRWRTWGVLPASARQGES